MLRRYTTRNPINKKKAGSMPEFKSKEDYEKWKAEQGNAVYYDYDK